METIGQVKDITTEREFEWKILYFSSLSGENFTAYYSPEFSFCNESWCLKMYPNGDYETSTGYVSLFLTKMSSGPPIKIKYSLGLKTLSGQKDSEYNTEYTFEKAKGGYGYGKFLLRSKLFQRKANLLPSDVITLFCTLQLPTSVETTVENRLSEKCSLCGDTVDADNLSVHQKIEKAVKCADCSAVLTLENWCRHECQRGKTDCNPTSPLVEKVSTGICFLCKKTVDADNLSIHQKKDKAIKCAECSAILSLQNWCDHECKVEETDCHPTTSLIEKPEMILKYKALQDYKDLFLKKEDCDVIIKVKEQEFHVHKLILQARLPTFAAAMKYDTKEKITGIIEIEDCDPSHFSDFLYFLYCGEVENLTVENVFSLFTVADKYIIPDLKFMCMDFIKQNISIDTFCNTIALALLHSEAELVKLCVDFFAKNMKEIMATVEWQSYILKNPIQCNEIMLKALEYDNHK